MPGVLVAGDGDAAVFADALADGVAQQVVQAGGNRRPDTVKPRNAQGGFDEDVVGQGNGVDDVLHQQVGVDLVGEVRALASSRKDIDPLADDFVGVAVKHRIRGAVGEGDPALGIDD